jgi:ABC-type glycerol-3-phosphate transport system substrate-binding protein
MKRNGWRWGAPAASVLAATTVTLALCGVAVAAPAKVKPELTPATSITVWAANAPAYNWQYKLIPAFEHDTGIQVNYVLNPDSEAFTTKLTTAQETRDSSYTVFENPQSSNSTYLSYKAITPITQWLHNSSYTPASFDLAGIPSSEFAQCTYKGQVYCIPLNNDAGPELFYNKAMFKAAGLTAPTSWAQVVTDANKLTTKNVAGMCMRGAESAPNGYPVLLMLPYFLPYSSSYLGEYLNAKGAPIFNTPQALTWADDYAQLMQKDAPRGVSAYQYSDCLSAFQNGQVAMWWDDSGLAPEVYLPSADPKEWRNAGIDELPCPSFNQTCLLSSPWGYYINANVPAAQQLAGYLFAEYVNTPSAQVDALNQAKDLIVATRPSTFDYAATHAAKYDVPTDYVEAAKYAVAHIEPNAIPATAAFPVIQNSLFVTLSDLITGSVTPKQAVRMLQSQMIPILQQYGLDK